MCLLEIASSTFAFLSIGFPLSEKSVILETLNLIVILAEWLPNVVGVSRVLVGAFLSCASVSLSEDFSTSDLVLLDHLNGEDVIDLNVMSRDAVMKEVGWEHHVVTGIPELWLILLVESKHVTGSDEAESTEDHVSAEEPDEETRVVEGSV